MKIFSAQQLRAWDEYTIVNEPVLPINLMERSAQKCSDWISTHFSKVNRIAIFCGKGNNGGDGLAIARQLMARNCEVAIYILEFGHLGTEEFQLNLAQIQRMSAHDLHFIQSIDNFPDLGAKELVIDALFGSGLNRATEGVTAKLIDHINESGKPIISIDIPSGLFADSNSGNSSIIHSSHTLTFQCYKIATILPENEQFIGELHVLDIDLHPAYLEFTESRLELITEKLVHTIQKPRKRFAHKGDFGHALIIAGSRGKSGAALLATRACLKSGVGLVTCYLPASCYLPLQTAVPEAMVEIDTNDNYISNIKIELPRYDAIGVGPGVGTNAETIMAIYRLFDNYRNPLVLDADALNAMASQPALQEMIPAGSILTPHPKEFDRMFGESNNSYERLERALSIADQKQVVIIVKGHHTLVALPGNKGYINSTGNSGMATGGSGDVLTGLLTGLLAQGYSSTEAAIFGVYIHGLAGDIAAAKSSMESMLSSDIIESFGTAFSSLRSAKASSL